MLNTFHWFSILIILLVTFAGRCLPLYRQEKAKSINELPFGQTFSTGVLYYFRINKLFKKRKDHEKSNNRNVYCYSKCIGFSDGLQQPR
jgi:hypothetical protein